MTKREGISVTERSALEVFDLLPRPTASVADVAARGVAPGDALSLPCPNDLTHVATVWSEAEGSFAVTCWACGFCERKLTLTALSGLLRGSADPLTLRQGGSEESLVIMSALDVPLPEPSLVDPVLDPLIQAAPNVTVLAGETSAGKTIFSRSMATALSKGEPFAGLAVSRAYRVLYVELETPEGLHRQVVEAMGRSGNLGFVRSLPKCLDESAGREALLQAIHSWQAEVVIIDPLSMAWPVKDENDNAQADRQMTALKRLTVEANIATVATWNMGEGNVKEKFRMRGATARTDRSDQVINYTETAANVRCAKIVKSRYGHLNFEVHVRFSGDYSFEPVEGIPNAPLTGRRALVGRIGSMVRGQGEMRRPDILAALSWSSAEQRLPAPSEDVVDKALHELVKTGALEQGEKRGVYRAPADADEVEVSQLDAGS